MQVHFSFNRSEVFFCSCKCSTEWLHLFFSLLFNKMPEFLRYFCIVFRMLTFGFFFLFTSIYPFCWRPIRLYRMFIQMFAVCMYCVYAWVTAENFEIFAKWKKKLSIQFWFFLSCTISITPKDNFLFVFFFSSINITCKVITILKSLPIWFLHMINFHISRYPLSPRRRHYDVRIQFLRSEK